VADPAYNQAMEYIIVRISKSIKSATEFYCGGFGWDPNKAYAVRFATKKLAEQRIIDRGFNGGKHVEYKVRGVK